MRGEPSGRRRFLDQLLVQLTPRLAGVLADYERVVRQRNTLLKSARGARAPGERLTTLEIWDERLVDLGSRDHRSARGARRPTAPARRGGLRGDRRSESAGRPRAELRIAGAARSRGRHRRGRMPRCAADGSRSRDRRAVHRRAARMRPRRARPGPHPRRPAPRRPAAHAQRSSRRGYASHGESWSFALSLKLASAALLRAESPTGDPVVILDDVFAELDEVAPRAPRGRDRRTTSRCSSPPRCSATCRTSSPAHIVRIRAGAIVDGGAREHDRPGRTRVTVSEHIRVYRRIRACSATRAPAGPGRPAARRAAATSRACRTARPRPARIGDVSSSHHHSAGLGLAARARRAARGVGRDRRRGDRRALRRRSAIEDGVLTVRCDSTAWASSCE